MAGGAVANEICMNTGQNGQVVNNGVPQDRSEKAWSDLKGIGAVGGFKRDV